MKLQDKETLSIATAVKDVLEKKTVKEIKYPHKMYSPDGKEVTANNKEEHEKFSAKGYTHEKPVEESPEEPRAAGEKEFKAKHAIKKSGMNTDGTNIKEGTITTSVSDPKQNKLAQTAKKAGLKVKIQPGKGDGMMGDDLATFTGPDAKLIKYFEDHMGFEGGSLKDLKQEFESVQKEGKVVYLNDPDEAELSPKQKKYQAFFQKALKKFGVKSPSELDGDKKKEFFDYVDKNYDAGEGEEDEQEVKKPKKEEVTITIDTTLLEAKKPGRGKTTADIDYMGDKAHAKTAEKKHKIKIKVTGRSTADITGEKKDIIAYLKDPDLYGMDDSDVEDIYPELYK